MSEQAATPAATTTPKPKKSVALSGTPAGNTALCTVGRSGNDLHYRGYDILEIADRCEFEEIAYLLVHGKLPSSAQLTNYKLKLKSLRGLPQAVKSDVLVDECLDLAPLRSLSGQYYRYGALLAGPSGARFVEIFLGGCAELGRRARAVDLAEEVGGVLADPCRVDRSWPVRRAHLVEDHPLEAAEAQQVILHALEFDALVAGRDAHLARQERVLEVGGVGDAGCQDDEGRIRDVRRRERPERRQQRSHAGQLPGHMPGTEHL